MMVSKGSMSCIPPAQESITGSSAEEDGSFEVMIAKHQGRKAPIAKEVLGLTMSVSNNTESCQERGQALLCILAYTPLTHFRHTY